MKTKLTNEVENFLNSPKGFKKSWIRVSIFIILSLAAFITVICLSYTMGPLSIKPIVPEEDLPPPDEEVIAFFSSKLSNVLQEQKNTVFINAATWISIAGICLIATPIIYLLAVWIVGVNKPSKTPYFHIFLWLITFIIVVLAFIAVIFLIRASIHNIDNSFVEEIPPPPETDVRLLISQLF
ncbi:MAG: hypothetical protein ACRC4L_03930 [Mycoplasma sp.]